MCFCTFFKEAYTLWYMKKNVIILISLVVLVAVLYGGSSLIKKSGVNNPSIKNVESSLSMKSVVGQVVRVFEGENTLEYGFDIPETATTSLDMDGALIKVTDILVSQEDGTEIPTPLTTLYISYEGARGYTPSDYISNIIAPHVSVINEVGTTTIGLYDWQVVESEASEWRIASVDSGKWLIVVENKKSVHDTVEKILESVSVK